MPGPDPVSAVLVGLEAVHVIVNMAIDLRQCPVEIRRTLELVRTLYTDLQHLITLRNERLPLLATKPAVLARTDEAITDAHRGLAEVCAIVEKLRPGIRTVGNTASFSRRVSWTFLDSRDFKSQEPLLARQYSSVLVESNLLRTMPPTPGRVGVPRACAFDNVDILNELMGNNRILGDDKEVVSSVVVKDTRGSGRGRGQACGDEKEVVVVLDERAGGDQAYCDDKEVVCSFVEQVMPSPVEGPGLRSRRSTVFDTEGTAMLFGGCSPVTPSPTVSASPSSARRPSSSLEPLPLFHDRPRSPQPTAVFPCPPPYGYPQKPAARPPPPPQPPVVPPSSPFQQLPDMPVSIIDPGDKYASFRGAAHHAKVTNRLAYQAAPPPPPPPPPSRPPRHLDVRQSTPFNEPITSWVPSLAPHPVPVPAIFSTAPSPPRAVAAPAWAPAPAPAPTPAPAPVPVFMFPGHSPPAYSETPQWSRFDSRTASFRGRENVWVDGASTRLSTIPPGLIYAPPQVSVPRTGMPAAYPPYPAC